VISVAIVAAERFELAHIGERPGWDIRKCALGPGPARASEAVRVAGRNAHVIVSTGLCGALDPELQVGDIFVATSVNGCKVAAPQSGRKYFSGPLRSVDRVVGTALEKSELFQSGVMAVEMEAAAVMQYAEQIGASFYCIRAVSDTADESFALDLNAARGSDGRFRVSRILAQFARRPLTIGPELFRLRRNAGQAAKALGAFLADCEF
jgi:adenosylhomocysteine nucleosidase